MRRRVLLALAALSGGAGLLWAASPTPSAKAPALPQRIVSINLCADQLVLALADRGQIAGLTKNATDAEMSGEAAKASAAAVTPRARAGDSRARASAA